MTSQPKKVGFIGNPPALPYRSKDNTGNIIHGHAARVLFANPAKISSAMDEANLEKIRAECSHLAFVTATMLHPRRAPAYVASYQATAPAFATEARVCGIASVGPM